MYLDQISYRRMLLVYKFIKFLFYRFIQKKKMHNSKERIHTKAAWLKIFHNDQGVQPKAIQVN